MEELETEEQFLQYARNGDLPGIQRLLEAKTRREAQINIDCKGKSKSNLGWTPLHLACYFGHKDVVEELLKAGANVNLPNNIGDTPLHKAAFTGRKEVVMLLLRYDACATVINGTAQIPKDVTQNAEIRSMLEAAERTEERKLEEKLLESAREGDLSTLSQLLNRKKPPDINCTDLLGNTPLHCAAYRGQRLCALKLLKSGADPNAKNKNGEIHQPQLVAANGIWKVLSESTMEKIMFLLFFCPFQMWLDMLEEHSAYSTHYCPPEQGSVGDSEEEEGGRMSLGELTDSLQVVCCLKLEHEFEKNKILSEALQTLATEHHKLEQSVVKGSSSRSALSEDEFYDAVSGELTSSQTLMGLEGDSVTNLVLSFLFSFSFNERRIIMCYFRMSLPAPMFSRNDFSIWSILRNCIGMELSKITMPVIFNEPLSFLQRLAEYMEHTYLIHQANASSDPIERMKCVAAFAVSAVASQWERTGKPFNPLLGETYELVREDLGFRLLSEQVSHHPPVSAFHVEGLRQDFVFHGSIYPKLKFWGKSVEAEPKGTITLELPKHNEAYTWTNPTCCVHNIIVGQLWIEQYGNVELINHRTGEKCCLNFKPCGLFGKELHKVEGYIFDKSKKKLCALYGKWTECLYVVDPAAFEAHKKSDKKSGEERKTSKGGSGVDQEEVPSPAADTVEVIPGSQLLWRIAPRPANSTQMYSFTCFAMQLNELRKEMEGVIPQTDCRLRPDIRAMENGDIDLASEEKKRLEEKQRAARKNRSKSDEEWKTRWFQQGQNPHTRSQDWLFSGGYWDRKYGQLPDIY
uniref:Oxysterol-binding protein n=1 Tax=Nothobranchius furzeri TaxID=105023 RepID=A0A8C6PFJ9_NOTFU